MQITHKPNTQVIRETTANWEHIVDDKLENSEIRVRYVSPTIADLDRAAQRIGDQKDSSMEWLATELEERVESLPDIVDEKGKPVKTDAAFFRSVSLRNLDSMQKAINGDLYPKSEDAKSASG